MRAQGRRRVAGLVIVTLTLVVLTYVFAIVDTGLNATSYPSGWLLLVVVLFLALFNIRKKLSPLGLGSGFLWMQAHTYLGLISIGCFLIHIDWTVPRGFLESSLAIVFTLVVITGVLGLIVSRVFARRLSLRGDEVIFERIPGFIRSLRLRAEKLVQDSIQAGGASTIAGFYEQRLAHFFAGPRNALGHVLGSNKPAARIVAELREQDRYLNPAEREITRELEQVVLMKDGLDFQHALQAALKYWLFLHIPLTYCVLLLIVLHVLVVAAFSGRLW